MKQVGCFVQRGIRSNAVRCVGLRQLQPCGRFVGLALLCAGMAFAQATSVGRAATGISNEAVQITRAIGIIILIVGGFAAAFSEGHGRAGIVGMVFGLLIAFGAPTIATWLQSF
jgi:hypothetical protein